MEPNVDTPRGPTRTQPGKRFAAAMALSFVLLIGAVAAVGAPARNATAGTTMPPCPAGHVPGPTACDACVCEWPSQPAGGITRERAIEIATAVSQANSELQPSAHAEFDTSRERWVWHVSWSWSAGPTAGEQCDILVDLLTGEILDRACAIA